MSRMPSPRATSSNKRSGGLLAAAWLLLVALLSGGGAWIFAMTRGVESPFPDRKPSSAILSLPPPSPAEKPVVGGPAASLVPVKTATPPVMPSPALNPEPPKAMPAEPSVSSRAPRAGQSLAPVEAALLREGPYGPTPRVSEDRKRAPWQVYAAPFLGKEADPRISVIVTGLGLAKDITHRAIVNLPSAISLSFNPYAPESSQTVALARQRGHEVLFDLALEPINYPIVDPGPATLRAVYSAADNVLRIDWVLAQAQGAIGVVAQFGDMFSASSMAMAPVAQALRERGLMYVDNRASDHPAMIRLSHDFAVPWAFADASIPSDAANEAKLLMAALQTLEKSSVQRRAVVALVPVSSVTIDTLVDWARTLGPRGFALAPVSAVANRQDERDAVRR